MFTYSNYFSDSDEFSISKMFTNSNYFSDSDEFSNSNILLEQQTRIESETSNCYITENTITFSTTHTCVIQETFTTSLFSLISYSLSFNSNYNIYSLSEINNKDSLSNGTNIKKKNSKVLIIGIVVAVVVVLATTVSIIAFIKYKKKKIIKKEEDNNEIDYPAQNNKSNSINNEDSVEYDIDFWL